jgi:ketosteroid isomerase-like protein
VHPFRLQTVTDRSHLPAGVPHLLDQYKQRRQAWLDQADELTRLRDEVRLAAEREALEIVTAARRDVRRVVVEARRELLVLTAQLHAAIESVDQASLPPGDASDVAHFAARVDNLGSVESLGATRDAVLGARREVRSVLDEARAEIEALAAEARTPLAEGPIPTLDTILGSGHTPHISHPVDTPHAEHAAPPPVAAVPPAIDLNAVADLPLERYQPARANHPDIDVPKVVDLPIAVDVPPAPAPLSVPPQLAVTAPPPSAAASPRLLAHENEFTTLGLQQPVSFVLATDADTMLGGFHKRDPEGRTGSPLATFGETGPINAPETQVAFLDDYDSGSRSRPMWAWVGMFAATGVLLLAGAAWWAQAREARNTVLASITATSPTAAPGSSDKLAPTGNEANSAAPTAAATPAGLSIEVRRTAWLRAIVDGKEDSRVYQAGETRNIVGARTVSLRAGDGGAVFVSVDGRQAEALGVSGTAVTRQYSLAGPTVVPAVASAGAPPPAATNATTQAGRPPAAAPPPASLNAGRAPAGLPRPADAPAAAAPVPQPAAASAPAAGTDAAAGGVPTGGRADLVSAGQQWLDAYQRRDRDGMASSGTENVTISDERTLTERFPAWQTGIRRDLDQVELELTGDTALLTARMTERSGENTSTSAQHVSRISQIWVRRNGRWRVADVRIMGEGRLNQIVR